MPTTATAYIAIPNKIANPCATCQQPVAVLAGAAVKRDGGYGWVTYCLGCAPAKPAPARVEPPVPTIVLAAGPQPGTLRVDIEGRLGDRFGDYRRACDASGARSKKDGAAWLTTLAVANGPRLVALLREAGLQVRVADTDVVQQIGEAAGRAKAMIESAEARLARIDAMLAPGGHQLRQYQREGVRWLVSRASRGALLADDMGTGKTLQVLATLQEAPRVIVVGPSVAKGSWKGELLKWRSDLTFRQIDGRSDLTCAGARARRRRKGDEVCAPAAPVPSLDVCDFFRMAPVGGRLVLPPPRPVQKGEKKPPVCGKTTTFRWPVRPGDVMVLNYEILPSEEHIAVLEETCPEGVTLVFDEAHLCKNSKAQRSVRGRRLAEVIRKHGGAVYTLSATPLSNRPPELWAVLSLAGVEREAFGSWQTFCACFDGHQDRWGGWTWGLPDASVADRLAKVMLRRTKDQVAKELPAKQHQLIELEVDRASLAPVEAEIKKLLKEGEDIDEILERIEDGKANGHLFRKMAGLRAAMAKAKIGATLDLVETYEEAEEPLLVFSAHRSVVDELAKREGWGRITGDESADDKTRIAAEFQAGKLKGIAATIKAGGVAITLTRASNVIFVDQAWNPADNVQAEDRAHRLGQRNTVTVTVLTANHPIDRRVSELLTYKQKMFNGSVNAARVQEGEVVLDLRADGVVDVYVPPVAGAAVDETGPDTELPPEPHRPAVRPSRKRLFWGRYDEATTDPDMGAVHTAQTPAEAWAVEALTTLTNLDPDRAMNKNDVGWSASDGGIGRELMLRASTEGLTDRGWGAALRLLAKYHRQVGRAPAAI